MTSEGVPFEPRVLRPAISWARENTVGTFHCYRIGAPPAPASRVGSNRFRGGKFYSVGYAKFLVACRKTAAEWVHESSAAPLSKPLIVLLDVAVTAAPSTKLLQPRGDIDNYAKGPLDGATHGGVWKDDTQVSIMTAVKRFTRPGEAPGVTMWFGELAPTIGLDLV